MKILLAFGGIKCIPGEEKCFSHKLLVRHVPLKLRKCWKWAGANVEEVIFFLIWKLRCSVRLKGFLTFTLWADKTCCTISKNIHYHQMNILIFLDIISRDNSMLCAHVFLKIVEQPLYCHISFTLLGITLLVTNQRIERFSGHVNCMMKAKAVAVLL